MQVPTLPPATTASPAPSGTLAVEFILSPNPAAGGDNVTAKGSAVWSTGTPPQGTAQILVCTPLHAPRMPLPVHPCQHIVEHLNDTILVRCTVNLHRQRLDV